MFCPKCGERSAEGLKFCRACGTDLQRVSEALSGRLPSISGAINPQTEYWIQHEEKKRSDPDKQWEDSIKNLCIGLAFLVVSIVLATTGVAGGRNWWFWMLIPAGALIGNGIASYFRAKRLERRRMQYGGGFAQTETLSSGATPNAALPPRQTLFANDYNPPVSAPTGELKSPPASVTEGTTRHLRHETEDKTRTLPQS